MGAGRFGGGVFSAVQRHGHIEVKSPPASLNARMVSSIRRIRVLNDGVRWPRWILYTAGAAALQTRAGVLERLRKTAVAAPKP